MIIKVEFSESTNQAGLSERSCQPLYNVTEVTIEKIKSKSDLDQMIDFIKALKPFINS